MRYRWFLFLLVILIGIAGSLYFLRVLKPPSTSGITPAELSIDYKTDYVLMVAETYRLNSNLEQATQRLSLLAAQPVGDGTPAAASAGEVVQQAINFAEKVGYADVDLEQMYDLLIDLQGIRRTAVP